MGVRQSVIELVLVFEIFHGVRRDGREQGFTHARAMKALIDLTMTAGANTGINVFLLGGSFRRSRRGNGFRGSRRRKDDSSRQKQRIQEESDLHDNSLS